VAGDTIDGECFLINLHWGHGHAQAKLEELLDAYRGERDQKKKKKALKAIKDAHDMLKPSKGLVVSGLRFRVLCEFSRREPGSARELSTEYTKKLKLRAGDGCEIRKSTLMEAQEAVIGEAIEYLGAMGFEGPFDKRVVAVLGDGPNNGNDERYGKIAALHEGFGGKTKKPVESAQKTMKDGLHVRLVNAPHNGNMGKGRKIALDEFLPAVANQDLEWKDFWIAAKVAFV
jgi:hypothetical protein